MLDMTPPPIGKKLKMTAPSHRIIMTKDTGIAVTLDVEDWKRCRDVLWYQKGKEIVNGQGVEMRVYLGIEFFALINPKAFDYRRKNG